MGSEGGKPSLRSVLEHYLSSPIGRMVHCPLHGDRNPSCSVNLDKGLWNCHSCGRGGDSWTMIQLMEETDFLGAVAFADKAGLALEDASGGEVVGNRWTGAGSGLRRRNRSGSRKVYRPKFRRGED